MNYNLWEPFSRFPNWLCCREDQWAEETDAGGASHVPEVEGGSGADQGRSGGRPAHRDVPANWGV